MLHANGDIFLLILGLGFRDFHPIEGSEATRIASVIPRHMNLRFLLVLHSTNSSAGRDRVSKVFRMGSSPIDSSVGALVWVRRRNGSWWPGRIMSIDELPESSLVSPRSGTPVKLLGREDASIDWYNLEKSKRIKAFRCGEHDVSIEKAKASSSNSSKKTTKYARRDDAILHALELERARSKSAPPMSDSSEEDKPKINCLENSSESAREISRSGLSFEPPNLFSSNKLQSEQGRIRRSPNYSEDDGTDGVKRMKGLEDLGMAVMSKSEDKGGNLVEPCRLERVCKVYSSSFKRKRSQDPNVHEFLKKRSRRKPLTKLLESTAIVATPVVYDEIGSPDPGLSDGRISGVGFSESKMSLSTVNNDLSDRVRVAGEDGIPLNTFQASTSNLNNSSSSFGLAEDNLSHRSLDLQFSGKQSNNESGSTSSATAHAHGTSKWQSKGKRNSRQERKKAFHKVPSSFKERICGSIMPERLLPYRQSRYSVHSRFQTSDSSAWNLSTESSLYSVKVQREVTHRPHHVPLVSSMSKSNGKAIVGHPLTVEILHDGFCDQWLNRAKSNLEGHGNRRGARPSSRTRRRTDKRLKLLPGISRRKWSITKKAAQLSKKIRKLSSLTAQKQFKNGVAPVLEKPESSVVACIPLKVVFSRINESLTGLMRSAHHPVTSINQ